MKLFFLLAISVAMLTGCTAPEQPGALALDHPANPNAVEVPLPAASRTLVMDAPATGAAGETTPTSGGSGHGSHVGHGDPAAAGDVAGMQHGAPAPATHDHAGGSSENRSPATQSGATAAAYVCPMHAEVTSDKPAKCPKCGMKLVARKPSEGAGK